MYPIRFGPATLPLAHPGLVRSVPPGPEPVGAGLAGGVVAVRLGDLVAVEGVSGTQVLVPGSAGRVRDGDLVAWCTVTAVAPAVLDADGRIAVDGWLPDQVRLGVLEEHLGRGTVEQVVANCAARPVEQDEVVPRRRQRLMSLPLVARLVLAMTLLPQASYVEALAQLVGVLPRLPWARPWQVPSSKVITAWRRRLGVDAMKALFDRVAGPVVAATDPAGLWHGLRVAALDGCQTRVADTEANRAAFGSSGTAEDGSDSPFPLVRIVLATARAGRAILAAALDASRVGEQTLTARLIAEHPHLFTAEYIYVVDRNFLSHDFIDSVHQGGQGAHLLMRVKDGIRLPIGGSSCGWSSTTSGCPTAPSANCSAWAPPCSTTTPTRPPTSPRCTGSGGAPRKPRSARPSPPSPTPAPHAARSCAPKNQTSSARKHGPG